MDSRKLILLVGALVVAAVTAFFARTLIAGSAAPQVAAMPAQPQVTGPEVLVATRALPVGTILDAAALKFQPWPKELITGAYYIKGENADLKTLIGTVVRNPITAGQPVTQGALVKPGDRGFLAAALGPGMRAVTVPIEGAAGVAGFVFPGDRIDLVLTQDVAGGGDGPPLRVGETILRNVRVLATDQRTDNTVDATTGKTEVKTFNSITVEATPKMAEQIAVAQKIGNLSLSLRSIADNATELEEAIASGDVKVPADGDARAEKAMMLQLANRPQNGPSTYATGADVSRFQRRSVPGRPSNGGSGSSRSTVDAPSMPAGSVSANASPAEVGPVVRVARGNSVTAVPVGGK